MDSANSSLSLPISFEHSSLFDPKKTTVILLGQRFMILFYAHEVIVVLLINKVFGWQALGDNRRRVQTSAINGSLFTANGTAPN
jgi:hypothetical protein